MAQTAAQLAASQKLGIGKPKPVVAPIPKPVVQPAPKPVTAPVTKPVTQPVAQPAGTGVFGGNNDGSRNNFPTTTPTTKPPVAKPPAPGSVPPGSTSVVTQMGNLVNNPTLPPGTQVKPTVQNVTPDQLQTAPTINPTATNGTTQVAQTATANAPTAIPAAQTTASTIGNNTPQMDAAHGQLSQDSNVEAAQGTVDPRSTMQGQYNDLMNFAPGETPDWAKGAVATSNADMAARGMGASSIAAGATTAALMEAAKPIASQDAQTYANMDMANLNNRQQAAVINAQSHVQMDMANLSNDQQAALTNTANRLTTLLSDQASENAASQFNATSANQVNEFNNNLASQIDQFNKTQTNAMSQFNAGETNAMTKFNSELSNLREQFNTSNQLVVDQSNVAWRRQVNTNNTATINAANQTNAANLLGISNSALNNIWQQARDEADFAFTAGQNQLARANNLAMASFAAQNQQNLLDQQQQATIAQSLGSFATSVFSNVDLGSLFGGSGNSAILGPLPGSP